MNKVSYSVLAGRTKMFFFLMRFLLGWAKGTMVPWAHPGKNASKIFYIT